MAALASGDASFTRIHSKESFVCAITDSRQSVMNCSTPYTGIIKVMSIIRIIYGHKLTQKNEINLLKAQKTVLIRWKKQEKMVLTDA
jgi:hypothetical protein